MALLATDNQGNAISALAPRSVTNHTLTTAAAQALAADDNKTRVVRLFTTASDCKIGVSNTSEAIMSLGGSTPEYIKVDAGLSLYALGSGSLEIVEMG